MAAALVLATLLLAPLSGAQTPKSNAPTQLSVNDTLQSKVQTEWEAFKKKDKNGYGELLADDFVAVEDDGNGERNKVQATNEVPASNIQNYSLTFFKCFALSPDAALVSYEITMEFPVKSVNRYKRVFISEIWLKRAGQWKLRHYQETRVR